ncbi:MAG: AraC family transcriptional regulator [Vicinamibacterales bacterium]
MDFPTKSISSFRPRVIADALQRPITRDLVPTAAGYFPDAGGHHVSREKGADEFIVIVCVAGAGWIRSGQRRQPVRAGEFVVLAPGERHAYGAADPAWTIYWCHFRGQRAVDYARTIATRDAEPTALGATARAVAGIVGLIQIMQHGYGRIDLVRAATSLAAWCGLLFQLRTEARIRGSDTGARVLKAAQWIRDHLAERLTVAEIAHVAGLSPAHFSTLFRERLGYSPLDFHLRARVQRACELFAAAPTSVATVAAAVGFSDPLYFSRVFRRVMREPPSAYLARVREGARAAAGVPRIES